MLPGKAGLSRCLVAGGRGFFVMARHFVGEQVVACGIEEFTDSVFQHGVLLVGLILLIHGGGF